MNARLKISSEPISFDDVVRDSVTTLLSRLIADESSPLGGLDRWTQRRIVAEINAKTDRVLESNDPMEHCYQNLIREIDSEAEMGVLLANDMLGSDALKAMCDDPGVSGELYREMERIAPAVFESEYTRWNGDLDLFSAAIQARYDRARLEADVSELVMQFLIDDADAAHDMSNALRSMFYAFREDGIRRQLDMPSLLDEREMRDLSVMVSELDARAAISKPYPPGLI